MKITVTWYALRWLPTYAKTSPVPTYTTLLSWAAAATDMPTKLTLLAWAETVKPQPITPKTKNK